MALEERVTEIIAEQLGVSKEEVVPEASFIDDLGADSLDIVELVMAMEEEFDIEIPDEPWGRRPASRRGDGHGVRVAARPRPRGHVGGGGGGLERSASTGPLR